MAKILTFLLLLAISLSAQESNFHVAPFSELKLKGTVKQTFEESCGAGALATMMGLYGVKTSEEDILKNASGTNMLSFAELTKISEKLHFQASGYKMTIETFNKLKAPVIARIDNRENYSHFVVVSNHEGEYVSVFDPSFGYYIESKREFFRWWAEESFGYVLIVMPQEVTTLPTISLQLPNRSLFMR